MPQKSFIQIIGMIYNYFLEYMMFIELNYHNVNIEQVELLIKNLNNNCDPIYDKSSCLWAVSRCYTFSSITKKLFGIKESQIIKKIKNISYENINFIHITIIPDHVFNLFKFKNEWYYISSWMLLYSGVIIKIRDINDFMLSIRKYFESSNFLINRRKNYDHFMSFIEKYFIFKLLNINDGNIIKINNFNLINSLIYRTGENMIEQMLNLNKIKKNVTINKQNNYELKIFTNNINLKNDDELAYDYIINNFYDNFVNSKNILLDVKSEFNNDYHFLKNNKHNFKKIIKSSFGLNKYQSKIIHYTLKIYNYNDTTHNSSYKNITLINKQNYHKIEKYGGYFSHELYNDGFLHFNNNYVLNQIFMGNVVNLYNPGFRTKNDDNCNIIIVLKYYNILNYFGYTQIFETLCEYLFNHYLKQKTYIIKKKYYSIINDNKQSESKVCVVNIYDNTYLYGFLIIKHNNKIQIILLESDNGKEISQDKILSHIYHIYTYEKIILIDDEHKLSLKKYNNIVANEINYCNIIEQCKKYYLDIIYKNNINTLKEFYLFLCNNIVNGNIELLKFKSTDLLNELTNGIIFDIIDLIHHDNNNTNYTKTSYMIDLGELIVNNNKYLFYKKLYSSLTT
jgi:hypothetical protein